MNHNMADTDNKNCGCGCCPPMASAYLIPQKIEAHAPLPMYKGDPFTYEDFTPEQIAGLQKPATDAAVEAQALMAGFSKAEVIRESNEQSRVGAENERVSREELRQKTEAARQTDEIAREAAEVKRAEAEAARGTAEQERAAEFASWETELDGKAEKSELSNIVGVPTEDVMEDIEPTLVTEALRKVPQALTPQEQAQVKANLNISKMELFCDLFNASAGDAGYARMVNGVFDGMLNGIPLTYEEAVDVHEAGPITSLDCRGRYYNLPIRTNLPPLLSGGNWGNGGYFDASTVSLCAACSEIEVLNLSVRTGNGGIVVRSQPNSATIGGCPKLRKIIGRIDLGTVNNPKASWGKQPFYNLPELVEANIYMLGASIDLSTCPKLSLASYQYCIQWGRNMTSPIAITVHPDVYAKLTDETNTEWHQVLIDAASKNITFATV